MTVSTPETNEHVTVFYADWCPFCARLRADLNQSETPYAAIDVIESRDI